MSKLSKALIAAAGNAGGEALYVEDVFSTYLYDGNGNSQTIRNGIALADSPGGGTSTSFDGVGDYLSRSSALTGATNSKTFTYNFWGIQDTASKRVYAYSIEDFTFRVYASADYIYILARNSSNSNILFGELTVSASIPISIGSWFNFLLSVDLTDNTKRHVFVNDQDITSSITWSTYTNDSIEFSKATQRVGRNRNDYTDGNLAHVYLDYTYRDLSIESNRRLFIDSDGGSTSVSTLSSLSPILYLPMTNSYAVGENIGTGGDFSVNGSPTIVNTGPEWLSGSGGLLWLKGRTGSSIDNYLTDTERGKGKALWSNLTNATFDDSSNWATGGFNSNGFTVPAAASSYYNKSGSTYASWTFRKAEKFFDVVTYTGTGSVQTIAHNLGSVPGMIIVKRTDSSNNWTCFHKSLASNGAGAWIELNNTDAAQTDPAVNYWNNTEPTDSVFTVATDSSVNGSGGTYVAYLFASDAGGFGDDGDESIIKCGSFTGTGTAGLEIDLGFEPQWLLIKNADRSISWHLTDSMRGLNLTSRSELYPNLSNAEWTGSPAIVSPTATGFVLGGANTYTNFSGENFIYIAIRRPMKTPESGTEVFAIDTAGGTSPTPPTYNSGFPVDFFFNKGTGGVDGYAGSRLQGAEYLTLNSTAAATSSSTYEYDFMDGARSYNWTNSSWYAWMFKRATGFFDVVAYTGAGGTGTINHNLGVVPEMIIVKARQATTADEWYVYHAGTWGDDGSDIFRIVTQGAEYTNGYFASTAPTAEYFKVGSSLNASGIGFVSYLFASLDGVSKVGTFTPSASVNTDVDCGFSSGARFVLIKSSVSGNWYIWDSSRGIVAGNDPYLLLNSTAAEVTIRDWIDPLSSGFTITSAYAGSTGSANKHIFLAIA